MIENYEVVRPLLTNNEGFSYARFNFKGQRHYIKKDLLSLMPSVTTILDAVMPSDFVVRKLIGEMGMSGFNEMMHVKGSYGTLMHTLINKYLLSSTKADERHLSKNEIFNIVKITIENLGLNVSLMNWVNDLTSDLLSIINFFQTHNVEPVMIEPIVSGKINGVMYAGAIDLLCYVDIEERGFFGEVYKSGEFKGKEKLSKRDLRVLAIVDYKSGKSGFRESHAAQLAMYQKGLMYTYGIPATHLFNVAPMNWTRETPTFSLKDQTDNKWCSDKALEAIMAMWELRQPVSKPTVRIFNEVINGCSAEECFTEIDLEDYVFNYFIKKGDLK